MDFIAKDLRPLAVPLETLTKDPKNLRIHDNRSIETVRNSLDRFGQRVPIVVRNGVVIAGNARLQAAQELGWTHIAVVSADELDEENAKLYAITDNRSAEVGSTWSEDLGKVLETLNAEDLGMLGWSDEELSDLLDLDFDEPEEMPEEEPDSIEPPKEPITKPGDLIQLGEHRLLCGDSTNPEDLTRLMEGATADCIFTDPPYAIYGSSTGIASDITDDKMVRPFFRDIVRTSLSILKPFGHLYFCCDWRSWSSWWEVSKGTGLAPKNMIVWDKGGGLGAMFANAHELLFFGSHRPLREGMTQKISGEKTVNGSNVWRINRVTNTGNTKRQHNAQKPIQLVMNALSASTVPGELVVDLFLGSGTTMLACEGAYRKCFGMEIDPAFCDVIVQRWEEYSGKKAVRP